jgi:hypothetical protein
LSNPTKELKMRADNEPTLTDMDDYDNKESPQKRRTIWLVVIFILAIGVIYTLFDRTSKQAQVIDTLPKSESK